MFIKFVDVDWLFFCVLCPCHMWLTRNHIFIRKIWWEFTSFIFWKFEIFFVSLRGFQNFKKVNAVNLSHISLVNIWLLVLITFNLIDLFFKARRVFKNVSIKFSKGSLNTGITKYFLIWQTSSPSQAKFRVHSLVVHLQLSRS